MKFTAWSVIQWILIVLVAAFIGHFGKVLAQAVLAKMRVKKADPSAGPSLPPAQENILPADVTTAGPEGKIGASPSPVPPDAAAEKTDKKMLKAQAKQAKKAAKKK